MVAIIKRMRKLNALLKIRIGKGAAILPPEITRIHLDFAVKSRDGHGGPKQFWRKYLPRLKYHNPSVPMTIHRTTDQDGPASMSIHFTTTSAAASIPPQVSTTTTAQTSSAPIVKSEAGPPTETVKTVNIKMRKESEILDELFKLTRAQPVKPTAEDLRQLQEINEQNLKSRKDQIMMEKVINDIKKEKAFLEQARGEVEAAKEH